MAMHHNYHVYIITNKLKNVLYIGFTNDLKRRIYEHKTGKFEGFAKKYNCQYLIYYEHFTQVKDAINREKEIKKWRRNKKDELISSFNQNWNFLNTEIQDQ